MIVTLSMIRQFAPPEVSVLLEEVEKLVGLVKVEVDVDMNELAIQAIAVKEAWKRAFEGK